MITCCRRCAWLCAAALCVNLGGCDKSESGAKLPGVDQLKSSAQTAANDAQKLAGDAAATIQAELSKSLSA